MDKEPDFPTKQYIFENFEYTRGSAQRHWRAWIWENIVLVAVSGVWPPQRYAEYFGSFWDIFCERKKHWNRVYFVFDSNNLPIQSEEFRRYVKDNWVHLLDREDYRLSIVESNSLKRTIWKSIYRLIDIQGKVHLFKDHQSALRWIGKERFQSGGGTKSLTSADSIPEAPSLGWVRKHAHIHLVGKDQLWSVTAWRNIIILKIQNRWTPELIEEYLGYISELPSLVLKKWNRVFLVFDVTRMEFPIKDAPRFLKSDWLRFLDRDDMKVCIVQKNKLNRFLWRQLLWQIGKPNDAKVFSDCDAALLWIYDQVKSYAQEST
jgi:hypothetical protein